MTQQLRRSASIASCVANLAVQVNYSYTRTTDLFGNSTSRTSRRASASSLARLHGGPGLDRHAAGRHALQRADVHRRAGAKVTAGGSGFLPTNGARLLHRLPRPRGRARQAAVEQVDGTRRRLVQQRARALRDPTRTLRHQRQPDADDHRAARRRRPVRAAEQRATARATSTSTRSGSSTRTAMYQAPFGIEARGQRLRPAGLSVPAVPARRRSAATSLVACW